MTKSIFFIFLIVFVMLFTACSTSEPTTVQHDINKFKEYVKLPFSPKSVSYEIVTLPESGGAPVPGPTDWIVLIAIVTADPPVSKDLQKLGLYNGPAGMPRNFVRPWFSKQQKIAASSLTNSETTKGPYYNIKPFLAREAKASFAMPINDSEFLIYVVYVSPT